MNIYLLSSSEDCWCHYREHCMWLNECTNEKTTRRLQYAHKLTYQYINLRAKWCTTALNQPTCWKWVQSNPTVYLAPLYWEYAQPVTRPSEEDIKICRLCCTSSWRVAIWQRVLICCVVCGALGQMCPLFTQRWALSTWAGAEGNTGWLVCTEGKSAREQYLCVFILFLTTQRSFWIKALGAMWHYRSAFKPNSMTAPARATLDVSVCFVALCCWELWV